MQENENNNWVIETKNLCKMYGPHLALDNINLKIPRGAVGVLGPNGAGKSTMMKILTTYINSSEGEAKVSGFDVDSDAKNVQQIVGYLPEHNPLYLDMYVKEYLSFNAGVYHITKSRID